ncbi:9041_t:CDS:2 [Rhizophagus irregularis]|nr:9041_t:CDS:2 [Rhizophagus irregularis]
MEQNVEVITSVIQQGGGDSDESWEDQSAPEISSRPQKKKRGKISSNACNKCKRDKKKCDGNYAIQSSCTYCLDHNEKCTYPEPGRRRPKNNPDLIENNLQDESIENTLISLTRFFSNLSHANQVNNIFKDQFFQLFVHPTTSIEQSLLLRKLWNLMNNNPNDSRFSIDNLNTIFITLTILIQNREVTVQQYFWELIESSSILPYNVSNNSIEQTFSATTTPQPEEDDTILSSQSFMDFFNYLMQDDNSTIIPYDNNSDSFQQSSTIQLDDHAQFFNSLLENSHENESIPSPQQSIQEDSSNREETKRQNEQTQSSPIIVQEKEELGPKSKQSKVANPTENRVKKRKASVQINEPTGSTSTTSTRTIKQRKTKQTSNNSRKSLTREREQTPQDESRISLFNELGQTEQLPYYINSTSNDISTDNEVNLILGIEEDHNEQL